MNAMNTAQDIFSIAQQEGLDPKKTGSGMIRCRCPRGCDAKKRRNSDFGSLIVCDTKKGSFGWLHCNKCGLDHNILGGQREDYKERVKMETEAKQKPVKARPPINMEKAWSKLVDARDEEYGDRLESWAMDRGWDEEIAVIFSRLPDVVFAPSGVRMFGDAGRLLKKTADLKGCNDKDEWVPSPRPVLFALRDLEGVIRSCMRRALGEIAPEDPNQKSVQLSLADRAGAGHLEKESLKAMQLVLGSLPQWVEALKRREPVYVVEGEPDFGYMAALCELEGVGAVIGSPSHGGLRGICRLAKQLILTEMPPNAEDEDDEMPRVFFVPHLGDHKDVGLRSMEESARSMSDVIAPVIISLPTESGKIDLAEYAESHGREALQVSLEDGGNHSMPFGSGRRSRPRRPLFAFTDLGNADRFVHDNARDLLYAKEQKKWFVYRNRWELDPSKEGLGAMALAKETAKSVAEDIDHPQVIAADRQKEARKWSLTSQGASSIRNMLDLAKSDARISISFDDLDKNPLLFGLPNGVMDLETMKMRPMRRSDMMTKVGGVEYTPGAKCPRWEQFIREIMAEDEELCRFLQVAVGYSLTGLTDEQCLFVVLGFGSNGKSTLIDTINAVTGDYSRNASFNTFLRRKSEGPRNDLAALRGARLVYASEPDRTKGLDEAVVKEITGGEPVTCRFLYGEDFVYTPEYTIFLSANHAPTINGGDEGIWRRIKTIPFRSTFYSKNDPRVKAQEIENPLFKDPTLKRKLAAELPGILNWALDGCRMWMGSRSLPSASAVTDATKSYREDMDVIGAFLAQNTTKSKGSKQSSKDLYKRYQTFMEDEGSRAISHKAFSQALQERGYKKSRTRTGVVYSGLLLK